MRSLRSEHWAGILLLFAAAFPIGSWVLMASWGEGAGLPVIAYSLSDENPNRWWFYWWAFLPMLLLFIAALFYKGYARSKRNALTVFSLLVAITALSAFISSAMVPVLLAPLFFSFRCVRGI